MSRLIYPDDNRDNRRSCFNNCYISPTSKMLISLGLAYKSDIDFWTKILLPKIRLIGEYIRYITYIEQYKKKKKKNEKVKKTNSD